MYIGSLMDKTSALSGNYYFARRGTQRLIPPDIYKEGCICEPTKAFNLYEGIMFSGSPFGWKGLKVFDVGVDLVIKFDRSCYIDTVIVKLSTKLGYGDIKVLTQNESGEEDLIGLRERHTDPMLNDKGVSGYSLRRSENSDNSKIYIPVGYSTNNLIVRFNSNLSDLIIESFDVTGAIFDSSVDVVPVYPIPFKFEQSNNEALSPYEYKKIIIYNKADEDCEFAAKLLKEKLNENYSLNIPVAFIDNIENSSEITECEGNILIGKYGDLMLLDKMFSEKPFSEGYNLKCESKCTYINALDRIGMIMGVEALLQLFKGKTKQCTVISKPILNIRGIHMGLPPREELPFFRRLIRYLIAPMGYNTLFLEFAGGMRYNRHPEINEAWERSNLEDRNSATPWISTVHGKMVSGGSYLEQDEVAELVAFARNYGIEVIPEVQSLSHIQYITCAHPEIGETEELKVGEERVDERTTDFKPSEKFANSYCPSNENSYKIIFDLIDEIVNVVKPKEYVHMGHDEVYTMGVCPLCKGKDHAILYASHVNRIHDYLAGKNLKMMIWSDMLQPSTRYKTPPAIDMLPKDIVMLDFIWYFNFELDYEDTLLEKGYKVMIGNLYSSHYPRYEKRIRKSNMIGAQISTWCRIDEETLAKEGKFFDILYTANMMWSDKYTENLRLFYGRIIVSMLADIRSKLHGEYYPSKALDKTTKPIVLPALKYNLPFRFKNILYKIPQNDVHYIMGIPFDLSSVKIISYKADKKNSIDSNTEQIKPDNDENICNIKVNSKYDSLIFLHTASENAERIAWGSFVEIGEYIILYEDGTNYRIPVTYGGNIRAWYQRYADPLSYQYYRHEGYIAAYAADPFITTKSYDGRDVTVYGYEWINPSKDKKIVSIKGLSTYESDSEIILLGITGITENRR